MRTRKYVEVFYDSRFLPEKAILEIESEEQLKKKQFDHAIGFRFFEMSESCVNGTITYGARANYSGLVCYGERKSVTEVMKTLFNEQKEILEFNLKSNNLKDVAVLKSGKVIELKDGDMTFSEFQNEKEKTKVK